MSGPVQLVLSTWALVVGGFIIGILIMLLNERRNRL